MSISVSGQVGIPEAGLLLCPGSRSRPIELQLTHVPPKGPSNHQPQKELRRGGRPVSLALSIRVFQHHKTSSSVTQTIFFFFSWELKYMRQSGLCPELHGEWFRRSATCLVVSNFLQPHGL